MARPRHPKASLRAQMIAVRRAASSAAMECRSKGDRLRSYLTKAEQHRDNLAEAARTLEAVAASREALDFMPEAQREQLAIRLAAAGFRAVRVEGETALPTGAGHV